MSPTNRIDDFVKGKIDLLFKEGLSKREIARRLKISEGSVRYNLKKLQELGTMANRYTAVKRATTAAEDLRFKLMAVREPFSSTYQMKMDVLGPDSTVSSSTIRRRLRAADFKGCHAAKKPFLKEEHLASRLEFAIAHRHWTVEQWSRVLFSDESKFNLFSSDGSVPVWRRRGQRYAPHLIIPTVKYGGGSIMVWGCFARSGVGMLRRIDGRMNRFQYIRILEDAMIPSAHMLLGGDFIFQQDNDPKHTSNAVKDFLQDPPGFDKVAVLPWPSQSPDLNPIEHLWDELKRSMRQVKRVCSNKADLYKLLESCWKKIPKSKLEKLVDSMPARCEAVIKAKGGMSRF